MIVIGNNKESSINNHFFHTLFDWYNDHFAKEFCLSEELKLQIENIGKFYKDADGISQQGKFCFFYLNSVDLVKLYRLISSFNTLQKDWLIPLSDLIFDMEDFCLRMCHINENNQDTTSNIEEILYNLEEAKDEHCHSLIKNIKLQLQTKKTDNIFYSFNNDPSTTCSSKRILKVLKLSFENSVNSIGGLGAVLKASNSAHKKMGLEKVVSLHPFYNHDKGKINVKFKGILVHQFYNDLIQSSIYKNPITKEYLVQSDIKYKSIFDVANSKKIYNSFTYSPAFDRSLYMASVSAEFGLKYCGKNGKKRIDIIQSEGNHIGGLAFELLSNFDNTSKKTEINSPKRIYLTHMLVASQHEQGIISSSLLTKIGANTVNYSPEINMTASGLMHSHLNIFVSKGVALDAIHESPEYNKNLKVATLTNGGASKVKAITNGINTSLFDPKNKKLFGELALNSLDFVTYKKELKKMLYESGVIADPHKELCVFVGRFSSEKGIDMLPSMIDEIHKQGAQCVIMGLKCADPSATEIINKLKAVSKNSNFLKVYDELTDQLDPFIDASKNRYKVNKGSLIRAASSISLVPSHAEACGLVPMEFHCNGSLVVAPYHQGLKDTCTPAEWEEVTDGVSLSLLDGANAVCYVNHHDVNEAKKAVKKAIMMLNDLNSREKNEFMQQTYALAHSSYGWVVEDSLTGLPIKGAALEYSKVYHDLVHKDKKNKDVETFEEAYNRIKINNKSAG